MSSDPCACRCQPVEAPQPHSVFFETLAPSFDVGFDATYAHVPASDGSFALYLALLTAVVPLTLAHQRRNSWCVLSLREPDASSNGRTRRLEGWRSKRLRLDWAQWARAGALFVRP